MDLQFTPTSVNLSPDRIDLSLKLFDGGREYMRAIGSALTATITVKDGEIIVKEGDSI